MGRIFFSPSIVCLYDYFVCVSASFPESFFFAVYSHSSASHQYTPIDFVYDNNIIVDYEVLQGTHGLFIVLMN